MPNIDIAAEGGGSFTAYLSAPSRGKGSGIILMHAIFGVNAEMRAYADDFAAHGFVALCPDMFWRLEPGVELTPGTPEGTRRSTEMARGFDAKTGVQDLKAALAALRRYPACTGKVGTVGYCLGGKMAYLMALDSDAECNVGYFGVGIEKLLDRAPQVARPLLLHIPENDEHCPPSAQQAIKTALHGRAEMHTYPGAGHAFNRVRGRNFHQEATTVSFGRTNEFLHRHLDGA
jgi:carboxymethylenebutenolidase